MNRLFFVCLFLLGIVGKAFSDNEVFREKEITICSGNFQLPGTLTLPLAGSHFPIVVLVHGSGPSDRDETIGPNKPFRDIAHGLAAKGIAVLRYEKRTKVYGAKSFPNDSVIIDAETTDDALAAIDLASTFKEVDAKRLYVVGHSLGGMLAPRIAERSRKPLSGIILLAANARSLEDLILEQTAYLASLSPLSGLANAQMEEMKKRIINIKKLGTVDFDRSILSPFNIPLSYWQSLHEYDQVKVAKSLHIPMLVLQGERDYNSSVEVVLVEGSVQLLDKQNHEILLKPDNLVAVKNGSAGKIRRVRAKDYTAWIDGLLILHNEPLKSVCDKLERFFDAPIVVNPNIELEIVDGKLDLSLPLSELIRMISIASSVDYKQNNGTFYMMEKNK